MLKKAARGIPDNEMHYVVIEAKRRQPSGKDDQVRETQREWAKAHPDEELWLFYFPDPNSPAAFCFSNYEAYDKFLENPKGEPERHGLYDLVYAANYGKIQTEEKQHEEIDVHYSRFVPPFAEPIHRGGSNQQEQPSASPSGGTRIPFRER